VSFFKFLILGENFSGMIEGRDDPVGFYVTRHIEADNREQAMTIALDHVEAELESMGLMRREGIISVEEIDEINASDVPLTEPGFVIFPHEEK
jgi:hypothetical protein